MHHTRPSKSGTDPDLIWPIVQLRRLSALSISVTLMPSALSLPLMQSRTLYGQGFIVPEPFSAAAGASTTAPSPSRSAAPGASCAGALLLLGDPACAVVPLHMLTGSAAATGVLSVSASEAGGTSLLPAWSSRSAYNDVNCAMSTQWICPNLLGLGRCATVCHGPHPTPAPFNLSPPHFW